MKNTTEWSENVIVVDADYIDKVAFDLIVNFERMIGRRMPQADMARWIDCVALDGGLREGNHHTQVVLIHDRQREGLSNFIPSSYLGELHGKAFSDNLGEFCISAYAVEHIVSKEDYIADVLQTLLKQAEVKRIMVVVDMEKPLIAATVRKVLSRGDYESLPTDGAMPETKRITVFAMQPISGGGFRQEILGYSLMAALGIKAEEIKANT